MGCVHPPVKVPPRQTSVQANTEYIDSICIPTKLATEKPPQLCISQIKNQPHRLSISTAHDSEGKRTAKTHTTSRVSNL